ncbi:hypothetical protein RHOER0001_5292 [Rhodococcus erythropolis SK121]|nr:hypothetical protein RHOER0001_5292 [Rhodococcus erythropolis SK121]
MSREKGRLLLHTVLSADLDDVSRQEHGCDRTETPVPPKCSAK